MSHERYAMLFADVGSRTASCHGEAMSDDPGGIPSSRERLPWMGADPAVPQREKMGAFAGPMKAVALLILLVIAFALVGHLV